MTYDYIPSIMDSGVNNSPPDTTGFQHLNSGARRFNIVRTIVSSLTETNFATLLSRLSATRAGYIDLLANGSYGLSAIKTQIPDGALSSLTTRLTATRAGYIDLLANGSYGLSAIKNQIPDNALANLTTRLSTARAAFLDNLDNNNLLDLPDLSNFTLDVTQRLAELMGDLVDLDTELGTEGLSFYDALSWRAVRLATKESNRLLGKKFFNITTSTTGARILGIQSLLDVINTVNANIKTWVNSNLTSDAHIALFSGLSFPISSTLDLLTNIECPRIAQITIFGFDLDFVANVDITLPELIFKVLEVAFPKWDFPNFSDVYFKNSENQYYDRNSLYQLGTAFSPDEKYAVWNDLWGKDIPFFVGIGILIFIITKVLGSESMKTVIRSLVKYSSSDTTNQLLKNATKLDNNKTSIDSNSDKLDINADKLDDLQTSVGDEADADDVPSVFGRVKDVRAASTQIQSVLDDLDDVVDNIKDQSLEAIKDQLNSIRSRIGIGIR